MMQEAKIALENSGYTVNKGIMAIAPRSRMVSKNCKIMTDVHRIGAINSICEENHLINKEGKRSTSWIQADGNGVNYKSGGLMARALKSIIGIDDNTTIFVVIGADTATKYPYSIKIPSVIVDREGYSLEIRNLMREEHILTMQEYLISLYVEKYQERLPQPN